MIIGEIKQNQTENRGGVVANAVYVEYLLKAIINIALTVVQKWWVLRMRLIDADKLLTKAQDYGEGQDKFIRGGKK